MTNLLTTKKQMNKANRLVIFQKYRNIMKLGIKINFQKIFQSVVAQEK